MRHKVPKMYKQINREKDSYKRMYKILTEECIGGINREREREGHRYSQLGPYKYTFEFEP